MKHTPGPWVEKNRKLIAKDGKSIGAAIYGTRPYPECNANSQLIATAPDLLKLLKEALRTFEMWKDVAPAVSLCADMDAAIKKAEGIGHE